MFFLHLITFKFRSGGKVKCFTDGTGPDVFKTCHKKWVKPDRKTKDVYNKYDAVEGYGDCSMQEPPSAMNEVCQQFHEKIDELK